MEGRKPAVLQNTILDDRWDDSCTIDQAILDSLRDDGDAADARQQVSFVLAALHEEIAQAEEREVYGELLEQIETYIDGFNRKQVGNMVDHVKTVQSFQIPLASKQRDASNPRTSDDKSIGRSEFEEFLNSQILPRISFGNNHQAPNKD